MRAGRLKSRLLKDKKNPLQLQIAGNYLGKTTCKVLYKTTVYSAVNKCD